ncbi:MAG: hypothetical protein JOY71_24265 [Acetobacteraceae bacterium]|nr:hypothetical protein [Verrucomicrobiota bacterium]MBV8525198.1 hypothetical protein [Acetobacteraceae bacterium]
MKQANPSVKGCALDQRICDETAPQAKEGLHKNSAIPETQNSRTPDSQKSSKREFYSKGTYRLCDAALDALGDAKKILKRQYGVKVNLEEIVETAILETYKDLIENKRTSRLVCEYFGNPEIRKI